MALPASADGCRPGIWLRRVYGRRLTIRELEEVLTPWGQKHPLIHISLLRRSGLLLYSIDHQGPNVGAGLVPARVGAGRSRDRTDSGGLSSSGRGGRNKANCESVAGVWRPPTHPG